MRVDSLGAEVCGIETTPWARRVGVLAAFALAACPGEARRSPAPRTFWISPRGIVVQGNDTRPVDPAEPVRVGWPPDDYTWAHAVPGDLR
jgi:hypothetical protein